MQHPKAALAGTQTAAPHPSGRMFRLTWLLWRWVPARRGTPMRVRILRRAGATVGENVLIGPRVTVLGPRGLVLEDGVGVARDALLDARAGLHLAAGAMIGFESLLLTYTHRFDDPEAPIGEQGAYGKPITIERNAWIGTRAIVMPGIVVGDGSIVGAGSVVTRSVPAGKVVAGNPAREIRDRG